MSFAHVGNKSVIGIHNFTQQLNLSRMIGAGFDHGNLMGCVQTQQRFGHTDMVVEISLRKEYIITFGEHGRYEFLGRRLAVGPCNLNNRTGKLMAVEGCQGLERRQHIIDQNQSVIVDY